MAISNEICFCYLAIGPHYVKKLISQFSKFPSTVEVAILTNTPQLLDDIDVPFKLHVIDLESVRDDWSRKNELVALAITEMEYFQQIDAIPQYKFPLPLYRFLLKWASDNDINRVILLDVGCEFRDMTIFYEIPNDSIVVPPFTNVTDAGDPRNNFKYYLDILHNHPFYNKIFDKWLPDIDHRLPSKGKCIIPYTRTSSTMVEIQSVIDFEGWIMGYLFSSTDKLKLFYNIWNDVVQAGTEVSKVTYFYGNSWSTPFESVLSPIHTLFNLYLDTTMTAPPHFAVAHAYTFGILKSNVSRQGNPL